MLIIFQIVLIVGLGTFAFYFIHLNKNIYSLLRIMALVGGFMLIEYIGKIDKSDLEHYKKVDSISYVLGVDSFEEDGKLFILYNDDQVGVNVGVPNIKFKSADYEWLVTGVPFNVDLYKSKPKSLLSAFNREIIYVLDK